MKTLKLLSILIAAGLAASAKVGAAAAHPNHANVPHGCSTINFTLTFKCQDENTHWKSHKSTARVTHVKVTNKDILSNIEEALEQDFDGYQLILCSDSGICDAGLYLWDPHGDPEGEELVEVNGDLDEEDWIFNIWCNCFVVTGSANDTYENPTGKWHSEGSVKFRFDFGDYGLWVCGLGKVKTEIKYSPDYHDNGDFACTESFEVSVSGDSWEDQADCCVVTGHVKGSGVDTCDWEWWYYFWYGQVTA